MDTTKSLLRIRVGRSTDTLARLQTAVMKSVNARRNGTGNYQTVLFSPVDAWAVAPDGYVAVVRANPYRVGWIPPAGAAVIGPAVFHRPVRISQAEKEFIASGAGGWRGLTSVTLVKLTSRSGGPSSRPTPPEPLPVKSLWFAKSKPAVNLRDDRWPLLDEQGRLWVQRSLPFRMKVSVFDVFDRRGHLVERVELPEGSRLVGFDQSWIYAARKDADDFEHLQRFPLAP